jgi:hypothetical protein
MTKAEWISVIKNTIKQGDETGLTRAPFIERHIQSVYEQMYNELYRQSPREIWNYVQDVSQSFVLESTDLSDGVTLTTIPINLPRNGGGLFRVTSLTVPADTYVITNKQGYENLDDTLFDTAGLKGQYVGYLAGSKFYANNTITAPHTLIFSMIPKFTSLSTTDEVMIPGGMEDHFIDRVIMTIKQSPPVIDQLNDNA